MRAETLALPDGPTTVRMRDAEGPTRGHALLLHGVPTSGRLWEDVAPALAARGYRVIAPDLPGYGATPPLLEPSLGVPEHLRWLRRVLAQLGVDPRQCHVAGQDFGGLIGAALAMWRGAASLTLTSSAVGHQWWLIRGTALPPFHLYFYHFHGGRLFLSQGVADERRDAFLEVHLPVLEADGGLQERMRRTALAFDRARLAGLRRALAASDLPRLCLWGRADRFFPAPAARWTAWRIGADLQWIEGARHYAPFCRPQAYAEALLAFWTGAGQRQ